MAKLSKRNDDDAGKAAEAHQTASRRPSNHDWFFGLILVLAVILVYQPVWYAGFIWDDDAHITANPCIIGPLGLKEIWTTAAGDICPLTLSTFWVEHALWDLDPLPYHLVNVALHAACAILLWRLLLGLEVPGAWIGAALWALHPVQVESVAWITETKNTQSALFFLLAILFFVRWLRARDREASHSTDGWSYALTCLFAALAMTSKSSTVILPIVLCLCAWWIEGRCRQRSIVATIPFFLMSIVAGAVSIWTVSEHAGITDPQWARSWPDRILVAGDAVWFYLGQLLWPHPLMAIYPRWQIHPGIWYACLPLLAVIAVSFIFWRKSDSWGRPFFFAWVYFIVALLPVLGLIDHFILRYSLVFDHFQYLASMGPLALVGAGLNCRAKFESSGKPGLQPILGAALLLILGALSWQRAWVYETEETLWADTLSKNHDCWLGYNNLGDALSKKGELNAAIVQFEKALAINPNYDKAHFNLANAYLQKGQLDDAISQFQKALEITPDFTSAHYNLGIALIVQGQTNEAIVQFQKTLLLQPHFVKAMDNLGTAFLQAGRPDDAIAQLRKAIDIDPNDARAHDQLGAALLQKGHVDEAITQFQEAVNLNPNDSDAQRNLSQAQAIQGTRPPNK